MLNIAVFTVHNFGCWRGVFCAVVSVGEIWY